MSGYLEVMADSAPTLESRFEFVPLGFNRKNGTRCSDSLSSSCIMEVPGAALAVLLLTAALSAHMRGEGSCGGGGAPRDSAARPDSPGEPGMQPRYLSSG